MKNLLAILMLLFASACAVVLIFSQTQVAPTVTTHRISGLRINPLAHEAFVDIEYLNFNGKPVETRKLILENKDYPAEFVQPLLDAIDAGLQVKSR